MNTYILNKSVVIDLHGCPESADMYGQHYEKGKKNYLQ